MANVKRVLVGAERFSTSLIPGKIILRGDTVTVTQETANNLDERVYFDSANNEHPVFVETSHKLAKEYVKKEDSPKSSASKKATKKSTRRKKST